MNRQQGIRLKNTLLAVLGGVNLSFAVGYAYCMGYTMLSLALLITLLLFFWLVSGAVIGLIITGFNERFKDPSMSLFQMYWASLTSASGLLVCSELDPLFFVLMLLPLVFGVFRLQVKQFQRYTFVVIFFLLCVMLSRTIWLEESVSFADSMVVWFSFSICSLTLSSLCRSVVRLQDRLRQKNDELEHAIQARSYFLANMSHEIRTPMNGVLGMLEISLNHTLSEDLRHNLSIARDSGKALLTVINDILDFSKIESGKLELDPTTFDISPFLDGVIAPFKAITHKKNIKLFLHVDKGLPKLITTDSCRLRQILNNLIGNAVKFTEQGTIRVFVSGQSLEGDRIRLAFLVEDTGLGIASDKLDLLFEHFTQADISTTRKYGGTGLGLAIVRNLCTLMGGDIFVASEIGVGSAFRFTIQATRASSDDVADEVDQLESSVDHLRDKVILLVEDNLTNQEVAKLILEDLGMTVVIANDGVEALALLREQKVRQIFFDLVLMDCQMPQMDGYEATSFIRKNEEFSWLRHIPVIAMTANAMKEDKDKCIAAGMNDYIPKPIDVPLLVETLSRWLFVKADIVPPQSEVDTPALSQVDMQSKSHEESKQIWNRNALERLVRGKPQRLVKLCVAFSESFDTMVDSVKCSISEGDFALLAKEIHGLKGAVGNLRFERLESVCKNIEVYANEQGEKDVDALLADFNLEVEAVKKALSSVLNP